MRHDKGSSLLEAQKKTSELEVEATSCFIQDC